MESDNIDTPLTNTGQAGLQELNATVPNSTNQPDHANAAGSHEGGGTSEEGMASQAATAAEVDLASQSNVGVAGGSDLTNPGEASPEHDDDGPRIEDGDPTRPFPYNQTRLVKRSRNSTNHVEIDYVCSICTGFIEIGEHVSIRKF